LIIDARSRLASRLNDPIANGDHHGLGIALTRAGGENVA